MKEMKFFVCEHCGNMVDVIYDAGVSMMCCGQKMTRLEAGTVEASHEKHIPVVSAEGGLVRVDIGAVTHPMTEEHHIAFIVLETNRGFQKADLAHEGAAEVVFALAEGESPVAVYEYCNLHGLWVSGDFQ